MHDFDAISSPLATRLAEALERIGLAQRSQARQRLGERGLTPTQGQILGLLAARGPLRVSTLAAELGVSQPTVSDSVAALLRKGLIVRRSDPEDMRASVFHLTRPGRAEAARLDAPPLAVAAAIECLPQAQQAELLRGLIQVIRALQEAGAIAPQRLCVTCRHFRPHRTNDPETPHFCALVGAAFGDRHLRVDCAEHEAAAPDQAAAAWRRLNGASVT